MNNQRRFGTICGLGMSFAMASVLAVSAQAQETTVQGLVIGRDGPAMSVRTHDTPRLLVVLSDTTKATEKGGFLGMSHRNLGITELVPGLAVKIEGAYDADHRLVAHKIVFSRGSLNTAKQIDAGLNPTHEQMLADEDQLRSDRKAIEATQAGLDTANQNIASNTEGINQGKQAIGQTNERIGTLDQFDTKDTFTVNFRNGSSVINKKDLDALTEFAKNAATVPGSMIEVQGYASKVGNPALNQRLSSERATNVLTVIQQAGVPLTRILAPAAMGTTEQVADNHSRAGQAQNRRVVVTIVVNKGITGGSSTAATPAPANTTAATTSTPTGNQ